MLCTHVLDFLPPGTGDHSSHPTSPGCSLLCKIVSINYTNLPLSEECTILLLTFGHA
jgi:hypothetical protein